MFLVQENQPNPTCSQHPVAGNLQKNAFEETTEKSRFSVASGGGTGRTPFTPDTVAARSRSHRTTGYYGKNAR